MKATVQKMMAEQFGDLTDPRREASCRHDLLDVVFLALLAVIGGAESYGDLADWARTHADWLRTRVGLERLPGVDVFRAVLSRLDPEDFADALLGWAKAVAARAPERIVALDGKSLRGSARGGLPALHTVAAWARGEGLVLAQRAVDAKTNEITVIPEVLALLDLNGAVVTIDAIGTQRAIAEQILAQGGDYLLPVKGNQPTLEKDLADYFSWAEALPEHSPERPALSEHEASDKGHGRIETRRCVASGELAGLAAADWPGAKSIARIERERRIGEKVSRECVLYLSSLPPDAARLADLARGHWGIEEVHWVLDTTFNEDRLNVYTDHGPENLAVLNRAAYNLLKAVKDPKQSLARTRKIAAWSTTLLDRVLAYLLALPGPANDA